MNTVDGTMRVDSTGVRVEVPGGPLAVEGVDTPTDGHAVVAGVRPEHLSIGDGPLSATVRAVEWLGHERHVYCDLGGTSVIVRDTEDGGGGARAGDEVRLAAAPGEVHLFDANTSERLN